MTYGIVFEDAADGGVGAYLPDMPGVAVVAADQAEALAMLDKAVQWHVKGMIEDGDPLPTPSDDLSKYRWVFALDRTFVQQVADGLKNVVVTESTATVPYATYRRHSVGRFVEDAHALA
jgi:predicted RNase H-like HicB family nuclease